MRISKGILQYITTNGDDFVVFRVQTFPRRNINDGFVGGVMLPVLRIFTGTIDQRSVSVLNAVETVTRLKVKEATPFRGGNYQGD